MLVKGIHHVSMKCNNQEKYEEEIRFYKDILGIPVARSWNTGMMFDTGSGVIEIFNNGDTQLEQGTIRHFALATEDVDACAKAVEGAGYEVFIQPKDSVIASTPGYPARIAFCRGPLGEEIEFFQDGMMMNVFDTIRTRRSTRSFLDKPVDVALIHKIVEAGRLAPSGGNAQSTHYIVISNKEKLKHLQEKVKDAFAAMEDTPDLYKSVRNSIKVSKEGNYIYDYNAPVLIITANQKDYGNNIADCACALENMMLAANELNLGSCWINQLKWLNENESILKEMYNLGMDTTERVYGALAIGWPNTENGLPNRVPLDRKGNKVTFIE